MSLTSMGPYQPILSSAAWSQNRKISALENAGSMRAPGNPGRQFGSWQQPAFGAGRWEAVPPHHPAVGSNPWHCWVGGRAATPARPYAAALAPGFAAPSAAGASIASTSTSVPAFDDGDPDTTSPNTCPSKFWTASGNVSSCSRQDFLKWR